MQSTSLTKQADSETVGGGIIPEPAPPLLLALGMLGLGVLGRVRRAAS